MQRAVAAGAEAPVPDQEGVDMSPTPLEIETVEEKRWLAWCGLPMVGAAVFVGLTFWTGKVWMLGPAVALLVFDITVIVYLAMSSDTNGATVDSSAPSPAHH
jgi:hypothetical protein